MNILSREKQIEVIAALCEGVGIRTAARLTGVNRGTVAGFALRVEIQLSVWIAMTTSSLSSIVRLLRQTFRRFGMGSNPAYMFWAAFSLSTAGSASIQSPKPW